MNLQEIQDKLHILLNSSERKTVFWYDDDASMKTRLTHLQLSGGSKVFKLYREQ